MELSNFQLSDIEHAIKSLNTLFAEIPLGNSDFQEEHFVIADQLTPERAYRQICLQLRANLNAARDCHFSKQRSEIKMQQLKEKKCSNKFDSQLNQIDIAELLWKISDIELQIRNYTHTIKLLSGYLEQFPKITREQFEEAEYTYFKKHLQNQVLGITGATKDMALIEAGLQMVLPALKEKEIEG